MVTDGEIKADGGRLPEVGIKTSNGLKSSRRPDILVERPDILVERPDGSRCGINVGKTRKNDSMIKREAEAINDLEGVGIEMHFVQYN